MKCTACKGTEKSKASTALSARFMMEAVKWINLYKRGFAKIIMSDWKILILNHKIARTLMEYAKP